MQELADVDPRLARSRARLIDATMALLLRGGVQAVTIDAVARESKVARTTIYRHFPNTDALIAAAFGELLPKVAAPSPRGTLRKQLTELLVTQDRLIEQAPTELIAIAWLAVIERSAGQRNADTGSLRQEIVNRYRRAFDDVLNSDKAKAELGEIDVDLAVAQLIGPIAFAHLVGLDSLGPARCEQIVRDFLAAHGHPG